MKSIWHRDGGWFKRWMATREMVGALGAAVAVAALQYGVSMWNGTATLTRPLLEAGAFFVAVFVCGYYRRKAIEATRAAEKTLAEVKKAHVDEMLQLHAKLSEATALAKDLRMERDATREGSALMLESLYAVAEMVRQVGPRPTEDEVLDVCAKATREASEALSAFLVGAGNVVVCTKKLLIKKGTAWVMRLAIWPAHSGDTEFPLANSRAIEELVSQRIQYKYVKDADAKYPQHVQFPARTILVSPIGIAPTHHIGFLWVSSELPEAFDPLPVYAYMKALAFQLAPLFVHDYAGVVPARTRNTAKR